MKRSRYWLLCAAALALTGCNVILPVYKEPEDGPRARVRIVYGGGGAKFHPGRDCYLRKYNSAQDVQGFRVPGLGLGRSLDMPLPPQGVGFYEEVYVRAGEPLTAFFALRREHTVSQQPSPDGSRLETVKAVESCNTIPFTFVPEPDANYEITFSYSGPYRCGTVLERIAQSDGGEYRRELMRPKTAPACK